MNYLYAIPWFVWIAWFIGWEAWGFRSNSDHWPTFSQLWKWWEARGERTRRTLATPVEIELATASNYLAVVPRGISEWSWFRWFTAIGLPVAAIVLEMHWVWEWF